MAEIDSLEIKITSEAGTAEKAIDSLVKSLGKLTASLKFDTSSLEKLGSISGNNFKKLGEGLQSFSNAAKNLQNVNSSNFEKLAGGIERIASIDSSKLEALGKIDGNSFRGLGEGVKALSSGLQNLQGVKKSDFNRLATGIERLAAIQPGNIEVVGNALRPLAEGINILSNAKFDNKNLTTLINSLTRLSNANTGSLANVDFAALGNSIKNLATALSGADKVSQNTISMTNAIAKLASAGGNIAAVTAGLPQLSAALKNFMQDMLGASAVNPSVISLSQAIGTLASAGGKTSTAAAGLATMATELKKFMQVMATAPAVNQNIIQMVNALARLASQGGRVGSASRDLVGGLDRTSSAMNRTKKSTFSLAAAFEKFYATYFLLIRGIKGFMRSIESTTDYIEAFNYYNVAFGKIAAEWDKDFEKYGYENAESYAESFTKRMNATLGKLSGVQVNLDTGLLEETGLQNLGLNIQEITQYASQLASVTNSIGQTGEVSLAAAKSMTMLAGDISSLFNVDYQSVANNLQSGLIGQSRALYKYGIDITNATLANYAYNLGLEKSVSEMTQAEKMQLRMLAILDQSKVSWGDLANTINSPSNMLRQFASNAKELSMVFGQLFIPVLQKVMPVINGITIALKRLLVSFAQILGINIDFEAFGQGYSEIEDGADGLADGLDGVAASAKKAKAGLRAFDELKVINMPDTSAKGTGGGTGAGIDLTDEILKATEEYEKAWNEAFAKMENTAQEWADKIEKILEPIKNIFKDFAVGDFFQAGKDVSGLVVSITDFFANAIDNVDWLGIGKKIGDFLAGIDWFAILKSVGNLIWQALKAAFELYVGAFSAAPLETALISLVAFPKLLKAITASKFITGIGKLWKNFKVWGEKIQLVGGALLGNKAAMSGLYILYPKLGAKVDAVKTAFSKFFSSVKTNGFWKTVDGGITNIRNNLGGLQKAAIVAVAGFAEFSVVSDSVEKLTLGTENWLAEIGKIAGVVAAAAGAMYVALGPAGLVMAAVTGLTAGIIGVENAMQQINAETIGNTIRNALENPGGVSMDEIAGAFNEKMSSIASSFDNVSQHSQALETAQTNIKNTYGEISSIESAMSQGAISVEDGVKRINEAFAGLSTDFNDAITALEQGIIGALGEGSVLRQYLSAMGYDVEALNGIVVGDVANIQQKFDELVQKYESIKESTNPEDIIEKEKIIKQMTDISGVFDETSQNMTAFKTSVENMHLNMGSVINTEDIGAISFESEKFGNSLQSMVDSYNSASDSISQGNETFQNNLATLNNMLKAAGIEENTATYSEIMSKIPEITTSADGDLKEAFNGIITTIQQDALNEIPALIEQAGKEWETLDFETRSELNYQGITNKDAYIASVVESYKEDVLSPMEEQINNALKSLNIDEEGVMVQKAQELYDSLFSYDYEWDLGGGERIFKMEENWKQILQEADLPGISEKYGKKASGALYDSLKEEIPGWAAYSEEGLAKAVEEKLTDISNTGDLMGDALDKGARARLGIKSPSTVFAEIGMYSALGFNKGIEGNTQSTIDTVSSYMDKIKQTFSGIVSVFEEIGKMVMQGFESGMSQMEGGLYDKANSIADNITQTIKSALEIHSPSRVMFELGDYTMQGFKEGMENLYNPITDSIKEFGYDVAVAPAPSFSDMYGGYQYQAAYTPQYGFAEYPQSSYNQRNTETNALLRQILSAIREGKTITIGQDEVGRASVRYIQGEERRLQKSLVGIY